MLAILPRASFSLHAEGVPTNSMPLNVGLLSGLLVFFLLILAAAAVITLGIGIWLHFRCKRKSPNATTSKCT